jgi:enoyl-CoA hydratase/carnithine racemase
MTDKMVLYEVSNGIARIILNRPAVNALNLEMIEDVVAAFETAGKDEGIRAVVLTSAVSKVFSAGLDLHNLLGKSKQKVRVLLQELYVRLHDTQYNLGKPSIAAVGGAARGGGMTLAISCDVILAGQSATFGYPEIDVGALDWLVSATTHWRSSAALAIGSSDAIVRRNRRPPTDLSKSLQCKVKMTCHFKCHLGQPLGTMPILSRPAGGIIASQ